jgi:hypothetical protein
MQKHADTLRVDFRDLIETNNHRYFENKIPNCTLALWLIDSTVRGVIADVDKQQSLTNLTESE